jgi:hypothetical protein
MLEFPYIGTRPVSVFFMTGVIFGFDLMIFYASFLVMNDKLK